MNLRLVHTPNPGPGAKTLEIPVRSFEEGMKVASILWEYDNLLGDDLVFSNMTDLEEFDDSDWRPWEDEDRVERAREYWALGAAFGLTEREIVDLVFKGLFVAERGCECPTCRERKGVNSS